MQDINTMLFLLLRAFGSRLDQLHVMDVVSLEALALVSVTVRGGPSASIFSGIVRGMSRNVRGTSIASFSLIATVHGMFGSVDCRSGPSFPS